MSGRERREWALEGQVAADELRLALNLGAEPITDLWQLIDDQPGLSLAFHDFGSDADGLYRWDGRRGLIVVNTRARWFGRKRFTAAHELGHHRMHGGGNRPPTEIYDQDVLDPAGQRREVEANAFAAYLLAPTAAMQAAFPGKRDAEVTVADVVGLMIRYGLSFSLAINRLANANRISQRERNRLKAEGAGEIEWELSAQGVTPEQPRESPLPPAYTASVLRAYRHGVIDDERLGQLLMLPAEEAVAHASRALPARREGEQPDLGELGAMLDEALRETDRET